jgi:hypothetical protein
MHIRPSIVSALLTNGDDKKITIDDCPVHFTVIVTPGGPGGFKEFFPTIQQRNLTIADIPQLIAAAETGGMLVTGPPLSDEEVDRLKAGQPLGQTAEPAASVGRTTVRIGLY